MINLEFIYEGLANFILILIGMIIGTHLTKRKFAKEKEKEQ